MRRIHSGITFILMAFLAASAFGSSQAITKEGASGEAWRHDDRVPQAQVTKHKVIKRSFLIVVDKKFYDALKKETRRLSVDIVRDLHAWCFTEIVDVGKTTPEAIKAKMQRLYERKGLLGALLIGDIPTAYWGDFSPSYVPFPTDAFYEDLDDTVWMDPDGNGIYNVTVDEDGDGEWDWFNKTWSDEHRREVYVGRLLPPASASLEERVELLRKYLERNHQYRIGRRNYQRGMVYAESVRHNGVESDGEDDFATVYARAEAMVDESWLFDRVSGDELQFVWSEDLTEHMNFWLNGVHKPYEYGFLNVHGSERSQWFGGSNWLTSSDYQDIAPRTLLIDFASCSNARFTDSDYLAGWALFAGEALAVVGNASPTFYIGDVKPNPDHRLLSLGLPLGEVRPARSLPDDSNFFMGDPTLRLRQPTKGPRIEVDGDPVIFPEEAADSLLAGTTGEKIVTVTNKGRWATRIYFRTFTLATMDGLVPWTGMGSHFHFEQWQDAIILEPGESHSITLDFYYDGDDGPSTYRQSFVVYTDSPETPYFWINMEKKLTP